MRKLPEWAVNSLVVVGAIIFIALLLELALIIAYPIPVYGQPEGLLEQTEYGYKLASSFTGVHGSTDYRYTIETNELGLHDVMGVTYESEKDTILFIGDSVTEGYGVLTHQTIPSSFSQSLNAEEYRVVNAGVRGFSTIDEYQYYLNEGVKFSPEYIVVILVENDLKESTQPKTIYKGFPFVEFGGKQKFMTNVFLTLRKTHTFRLFWYEMYANNKQYVPSQSNAAAQELATRDDLYELFEETVVQWNTKASEEGTTLVFVIAPWLKAYQIEDSYENTEGHVQVIERMRNVLDTNAIEYIDITEEMKASQQETDLYFPLLDGHPNEEGTAILGALIAEKFEEKYLSR